MIFGFQGGFSPQNLRTLVKTAEATRKIETSDILHTNKTQRDQSLMKALPNEILDDYNNSLANQNIAFISKTGNTSKTTKTNTKTENTSKTTNTNTETKAKLRTNNAEVEAIKKIIDEDIEKTFDMFS